MTYRKEKYQPTYEPPRRSPRTCLKCGREFASAGPGNRTCAWCARDNERVYLPPGCGAGRDDDLLDRGGRVVRKAIEKT